MVDLMRKIRLTFDLAVTGPETYEETQDRVKRLVILIQEEAKRRGLVVTDRGWGDIEA